MKRYFTKTFVRFFFAFVAIIAVAFGVVLIAGIYIPPRAVDNVAQPR